MRKTGKQRQKMKSYNRDEPETIQAMFSSIAKNYDRTNAVLSLQMHKKWNRELIQNTTYNQPQTLLDLCCGTGDIAFAYLHEMPEQKQALMLDFCEEMLECAKHKADKQNLDRHQISYIKADAQNIPLVSGSIPCATMAYGIRNIQDPVKCIREVYRVLEPGGVFGILELTRPSNPLMKIGHCLYLKTMLPILGKWMTSNQAAYKYLQKSIDKFIPSDTLEKMMIEAGFKKTAQKKLTGGIATIITGVK